MFPKNKIWQQYLLFINANAKTHKKTRKWYLMIGRLWQEFFICMNINLVVAHAKNAYKKKQIYLKKHNNIHCFIWTWFFVVTKFYVYTKKNVFKHSIFTNWEKKTQILVTRVEFIFLFNAMSLHTRITTEISTIF